MEKKLNKGITLVALVVTIIVLLILAAVSINLVLGENGIITRAVESKEKTKISQFSENIKLEEENYLINLEQLLEDEARKELYDRLIQHGYTVFNEKDELIDNNNKMYNAVDFIVKKDDMRETIELESVGNRFLVSNETELREALTYIKDNELEDVQIQVIKSFPVDNDVEMENIDFLIRKNLTITANAKFTMLGNSVIAGQENSILARGADYSGTVIDFQTGLELNLKNLIIEGNGTWTGEIDEFLNRGTQYNKSTGYNGNAIINLGYNTNYCSFTMDNVTVQNVATNQTGGNIYCGRYGDVVIKNCNFYNNTGSNSTDLAGSAGVFWFTSYPTILFDNCNFKGNSSYGNHYSNGGGAIRIQNGLATIKNCTFENNGTFGGNYGGAIYFYNGTFMMEKCKFRKNYSSNGAALRTYEKPAEVKNCEFYENQTSGVGAVLSCPKSKAKFVSCVFENNKGLGSDGLGGILWGGTELTLENCSIKSNTNTNTDPTSLASAMISAETKLQLSGDIIINENNNNLYIGNGLKNLNIEIISTLTKANSIKIEIDTNITTDTVVATGKDYTLTNKDLSAFKCETAGYSLKLDTNTNQIIIYKN